MTEVECAHNNILASVDGSKKKSEPILESTSTQVAGLKSIDNDIELGNGLMALSYATAVVALRTILEEYNTVLTDVDVKRSAFKLKQKEVKDVTDVSKRLFYNSDNTRTLHESVFDFDRAIS